MLNGFVRVTTRCKNYKKSSVRILVLCVLKKCWDVPNEKGFAVDDLCQ